MAGCYRYVTMACMSHEQTAIPCAIIRGGTSRALFFHKDDLPTDTQTRDKLLLSAIGGPDALQVDGIGGGHALTNKIAIINRSERDDADIDYLFLQALPGEEKLSSLQNCGNILAGVGIYAMETGLYPANDEKTVIKVFMINSGNLAELTYQTPDKQITYAGNTEIDGVPGKAAGIVCDFLDIAGSACGSLLPTGNVTDVIDGVEVTCIDNGMPVVLLKAEDFAISGYETPEELDSNEKLKSRLEAIRLKLGTLMNLGDVKDQTVPKMCLVAKPQHNGMISTRTFIPHVCHRSIGVLGAVSVASACTLPGSITADIAVVPEGKNKTATVEHPSGTFAIRLTVEPEVDVEKIVQRAGVLRTARLIMRGEIQIPSSIYQ